MDASASVCGECLDKEAKAEKSKYLHSLNQKTVCERLEILESEMYDSKRHKHYNPNKIYR